MIIIIALGVFCVCISIIFGQSALVGRGRPPTIGVVGRSLLLIGVGISLFVIGAHALACEAEDDRTEIELITEYIPCQGGWCRRNND